MTAYNVSVVQVFLMVFTNIGALHASTSQKWVKFDTQHKVFCIPWFQSVAVAWRFIWRFKITSELVIDGLLLRVCWGLLVCPKMPTGALPSRYTLRATPNDTFFLQCGIPYVAFYHPKGHIYTNNKWCKCNWVWRKKRKVKHVLQLQ